MDSEETSLESTSSAEPMHHLPRSPLHHSRSRDCCNVQICLAYFLSVIASLVIVFGTVLYLRTWHQMFLVLPGVGIVLILVGSCLYRSGVLLLTRGPSRSKSGHARKRNRTKRGAVRDSRLFESHLSLNMLPQCFTSFEGAGSSRQANCSTTRYLSLPIDSSQAVGITTTNLSSTLPHPVSTQPCLVQVEPQVLVAMCTTPTPSEELPDEQIYQTIEQIQSRSSSSTSVISNNSSLADEAPPSYEDVIEHTMPSQSSTEPDSSHYRTL